MSYATSVHRLSTISQRACNFDGLQATPGTHLSLAYGSVYSPTSKKGHKGSVRHASVRFFWVVDSCSVPAEVRNA